MRRLHLVRPHVLFLTFHHTEAAVGAYGQPSARSKRCVPSNVCCFSAIPAHTVPHVHSSPANSCTCMCVTCRPQVVECAGAAGKQPWSSVSRPLLSRGPQQCPHACYAATTCCSVSPPDIHPAPRAWKQDSIPWRAQRLRVCSPMPKRILTSIPHATLMYKWQSPTCRARMPVGRLCKHESRHDAHTTTCQA
jgi:hypothetical protein